jgi:hypothetical protein
MRHPFLLYLYIVVSKNQFKAVMALFIRETTSSFPINSQISATPGP